MFQNIGLTADYDSKLRFEVDGANAGRDFLRTRAISEADVENVWYAIALHTTPGIFEHMHPKVFLVQTGAGMDVTGRGYANFSEDQHRSVVSACPSTK